MDCFYTSPELADALISLAAPSRRQITIADFACGEGSLVLAAERRWPAARMIANDVSAPMVARVRKLRPGWTLSCADFINRRSVSSSALRHHFECVDLVVLNPPFSRKDKRTYSVQLDGEYFSASIALTFVVKSIPFLRPSGVILAVLPDGCLVGLHDQPVWEALKRQFRVEIIRDNARSAFQGVRARTCLVRMTKLDRVQSVAVDRTASIDRRLNVVRGICQMHSRKTVHASDGAQLVHTSHLQAGQVKCSDEYVTGRVLQGPALLFPRVGLVTAGKLCVLGAGAQVVLSDCVLAVKCLSQTAANSLRRQILATWPKFASGYRGTGAPYITVQRASALLAELMSTGRGEEMGAHSQVQIPTDCS
jgi:tRNA1(Val) A37 N6-methylase TrmN6